MTRIKTCQALDPDGRKCTKPGYKYTKYHGDRECYTYDGCMPSWVRVMLCFYHTDKV